MTPRLWRLGADVHGRTGLTVGRQELLAVLAGAVSGAAGAYCYYNDPWRPLAHSFVVWITLAVVVSARATVGQGVLRAVLALLAAVATFDLGKWLYYAVRYPGMPYGVDPVYLALWLAAGLVAGTALGALGSALGRIGWWGAAATASVVGLIAADAYRVESRDSTLLDDGLLILFAALAIPVVLLLGWRSASQVLRTGLLLPVTTVLGFTVLALPDWAEQLLL